MIKSYFQNLKRLLFRGKTNARIVGIGAILQSNNGTYLLQERDDYIARYPGMYTPWGGARENNESTEDCLKRELLEELELDISTEKLHDLGIFDSTYEPERAIHLFLIRNVDPSGLVLHEGKSIVELNKEEALLHQKVTEFTKQALRLL